MLKRMVSTWSFEQVVTKKPTLIDVRPLDEIRKNGGTIPNALCIPLSELSDILSQSAIELKSRYGREISHDSPLVFFCQAGVRGMKGAAIAESLGFSKAGCYAGSWSEWCERGGPKEPK